MDQLTLTNAKAFELYGVSFAVEIFPSPILENLKACELRIKTRADVFQASGQFGNRPLFTHHTDFIDGNVDGKTGVIGNREFLNWQISRMKSSELYEWINKSQTFLEDVLDHQKETEVDPDYSPADWLSASYPEFKDKGVAFIDRLRKEKEVLFYERIVSSVLAEETSLTSWLETKIDPKLKKLQKYENWDCSLAIVSSGEFHLSFDDETGLYCLDDSKLIDMYVRNFDEGEVD